MVGQGLGMPGHGPLARTAWPDDGELEGRAPHARRACDVGHLSDRRTGVVGGGHHGPSRVHGGLVHLPPEPTFGVPRCCVDRRPVAPCADRPQRVRAHPGFAMGLRTSCGIARRLASVRTPASVLAEILRSDPARPRVTFYEDTPGPTHGERIELSGKVLNNWISKAGNALQDEYDVGPGSIVRLALPPHWRALYWAFAVWSVGGTVDCAGDGSPDLLICDDPDLAATHDQPPDDVVLVT